MILSLQNQSSLPPLIAKKEDAVPTKLLRVKLELEQKQDEVTRPAPQ